MLPKAKKSEIQTKAHEKVAGRKWRDSLIAAKTASFPKREYMKSIKFLAPIVYFETKSEPSTSSPNTA